MKKTLLLILFLLCSGITNAQQVSSQAIPSVVLKTLDGKAFNTSQISNDSKPILIIFWATWAAPAKNELNTIAESFETLVEETGVKVVAIAIDDARTSPKVKPYVDSKAWEFEVYIDENQNLKRAMSVDNVPHTFLLNSNRQIVWQNPTYSESNYDTVVGKIRKLLNGESLE